MRLCKCILSDILSHLKDEDFEIMPSFRKNSIALHKLSWMAIFEKRNMSEYSCYFPRGNFSTTQIGWCERIRLHHQSIKRLSIELNRSSNLSILLSDRNVIGTSWGAVKLNYTANLLSGISLLSSHSKMIFLTLAYRHSISFLSSPNILVDVFLSTFGIFTLNMQQLRLYTS